MFSLTKTKIWRLYLLAIIFAMALPVCAYEPEYADNAKKVRLRWKTGTINLALSNSLRQPAPNFKVNSDVAGAVRRSLKTWEAAANVKFAVVWTDKQSISASEGAGDGSSLITIAATPENVAPFQAEASEMPGRTRLFFNSRGRITEADIVLNPYQQFSTDGSFGTYDLEAALTHEIGHLLGLSHSSVMAATMYAQQGKNGTFSLPGFAPRTLAEDDRAGVRWLYGAKTEDEACCGAVAGTILSVEGKQLPNWQVWAEDNVAGKLLASVKTNASGAFQIGGLTRGTYRIIAQPENGSYSAEILGDATVENGKISALNRKIALHKTESQPFFVGYNAQLSTLAVPLDAESLQTIFIGGNNLALEELLIERLSTSSVFLKIIPTTLTKQDFDVAFPVASFNLRINPEAPAGEYSLRWQRASGESVYVLGCFSIDVE